MSSEQRQHFGWNLPKLIYEELCEKYVCFSCSGSQVYGLLKEVTNDRFLVLNHVPTKRIGQNGLESCFKDSVSFPIQRLGPIRISSKKEVENVKRNLVPYEGHIGKPVIIKNGSQPHFGKLHRILPDYLELKPSLVPKFDPDGFGHILSWEFERPTCIGNVVEVTPVSMEDLDGIRTASQLEYSVGRQQRELVISELTLKDGQLKRAIEEMRPSLVHS